MCTCRHLREAVDFLPAGCLGRGSRQSTVFLGPQQVTSGGAEPPSLRRRCDPSLGACARKGAQPPSGGSWNSLSIGKDDGFSNERPHEVRVGGIEHLAAVDLAPAGLDFGDNPGRAVEVVERGKTVGRSGFPVDDN